MPESLSLAGGKHNFEIINSMAALGFLIYMTLDRLAILHSDSKEHQVKNKIKGRIGAGSLSIHSFLDGIAIGFVFKISVSMGTIVAVAVITHGLSDGINTVMVVIKNNYKRKKAVKWLLINSLAPVAGILSTFFFSLPASSLGLVLALFAGFFFYLGATDLLPECQHEYSIGSTIMTILGAVVIYAAVRLSGY